MTPSEGEQVGDQIGDLLSAQALRILIVHEIAVAANEVGGGLDDALVSVFASG